MNTARVCVGLPDWYTYLYRVQSSGLLIICWYEISSLNVYTYIVYICMCAYSQMFPASWRYVFQKRKPSPSDNHVIITLNNPIINCLYIKPLFSFMVVLITLQLLISPDFLDNRHCNRAKLQYDMIKVEAESLSVLLADSRQYEEPQSTWMPVPESQHLLVRRLWLVDHLLQWPIWRS